MAGSGKYSVEIGVSQERKREENQVDRFRRVAQELGCDEDEAAFDEKLKAVVGPKARNKPEKSKESD